ncbi:MAG: hypothetical protein BMS9Abin11_1022 [Gammaproteobacteria bacterium]|nr:MAG: hypothetical protein BMS9Abin11_1022 [Gammaproteobacteria bacterium]
MMILLSYYALFVNAWRIAMKGKVGYLGKGRYGTQWKWVTDLSDEKFNKLLVKGHVEGSSPPKWACLCDCGTKVIVRGNNLKNGHTKSCGCLQKVGKKTHGKSYHYLYHIWHNMHDRCNNPKSNRWNRYGGRGIKVCNDWGDIDTFLADMGPRPKGYSLERKNFDGNYEPNNCKWATPIEQASNKSNNVYLTANGVTDTIAGWARRTGIAGSTIRKRVFVHKWPHKKAVNTPTPLMRASLG